MGRCERMALRRRYQDRHSCTCFPHISTQLVCLETEELIGRLSREVTASENPSDDYRLPEISLCMG